MEKNDRSALGVFSERKRAEALVTRQIQSNKSEQTQCELSWPALSNARAGEWDRP